MQMEGIIKSKTERLKENERIIYMIYIQSLCTNGAMYPLWY